MLASRPGVGHLCEVTTNRDGQERGRVLWVNGPFGVGKSTAAACVAERLDGACLFNPEDVGGVLRRSLGNIADYRVWPEWRRLVVAFLDELTKTHRWVVVPMCVSHRQQWTEIADAIASVGVPLAAAVLIGDEDALIQRISRSDVEDHTKRFRLARLHEELEALTPDFGKLVDTTYRSTDEVCDDVLVVARAMTR
jgi:hypothetical protein